MASRSNRKKKEREARGDFGVPGVRVTKSADGTTQLAIDARVLPVPDRSYYSNTLKLHKRENIAAFLFGQLAPDIDDIVHAVVSIEMPDVAIAWVVGTFDDAFRASISKIGGELPPYPPGSVETPTQIAFVGPAHITRLMLNDVGGVLDFYEVTPNLQHASEVIPVLRVKATLSVLKLFVSECDRIVGTETK